MLGKVKTFIKNCIKEVITEQQQAQKDKNTPAKRHRDFGADISSMDIKRSNAEEMLKLSFQKSVEDFVVNRIGADGQTIATDAIDTYKDMPMPNIQPGTAKDIVFTFFSKFGFIGWQLCAVLAQHWLISNACSIPAKDAIRNGWQNIFADKDKEEDTENKEKEQKFLNELNEIANTKFKLSQKAIQWITKYNIFGIGIALPIIDGIKYEEPFNPDGIKKGSFKGISVIDPYWVIPDFDEKAMTDPISPDFYEPTYYRVVNGSKIQRVHKSHLIIARRKEVPDILKPTYYFGGIPLTQEIYERVYAAEKSANEQPLLLLTKRVNGWKIDLEAFFTNPKKYTERIKNFTEYRDNQGVLLIDHEDEMFQIDTSLSDLDQVVMSQYKLVAAVARIPVDKLFELNPSGSLSNSGDYNIKNYNQDLNTIQNDLFKPFIDRINEIVMRSYYDRKDKIAIIFNPTDNPTAKEQADSVKAEVDTLQTLIGTNVITTEEARQKLISDKDNGFSFLDEEAPEPEDNEEIQKMMAEMKGGNNIPNKQQQQQKQPIPQAQGKDSTAEDTDWITVHPHGKETKGVPVPVEEGQNKGEAIKSHFQRLSNPEEFGDIDFDPEELNKQNEEAEKKAKNKALKKEMSQWNKMSEEEKEAERNEFYEAEEQQSKEKNKEKQNHTLVHEKQILEDMGISRIKKPTPEDDIYKEYNDLSPRIKRYFFTDNKNALKWDEAQQILQEHKGNDTENIFEYLRVIDIKTPQSRTNERTRNYLKGEQAEDAREYNRDDFGRFAKVNSSKNKEEKKQIETEQILKYFEQIKKSVPKEIADKMNAVNIDYTKDNILPEINKKEADELGVEILPIRLKQNSIEIHRSRHPEVDPKTENALLATALYAPDNTAAGKGKGYIHFAKHIGNNKNSLVLLDMEKTEDGFYDIVHYFFINDKKRKKVMNEK